MAISMALGRIMKTSQRPLKIQQAIHSGNNDHSFEEEEIISIRPWIMILGLVIVTQLLVVFVRIVTI